MNADELMQSYNEHLQKLLQTNQKVQAGFALRGWDSFDIRSDFEDIMEHAQKVAQLSSDLIDQIAVIRGRYASPWWSETIKVPEDRS